MELSLGLEDAILDGVVREAGLKPQRQGGVVCDDLSGNTRGGLAQDLPGTGRKLVWLGEGIGRARLCKPHPRHPQWSVSQGDSKWRLYLDPSASFF